MVRKYGHGWFRESTRHSLAARGIKTTYFAGKSKKRMIESLIRQGRFAEAEELKKKQTSPIPPDPKSGKSVRKRKLASMEVENLLDFMFQSDMDPEDKARLEEVKEELRGLGKNVDEVNDARERSRLVQTRLGLVPADLKSERWREKAKDEGWEFTESGEFVELSDEDKKAFELELEKLEKTIDENLTPEMVKKHSVLLDELGELTGKPRKAFTSGWLTKDQARRRLGKERANEVEGEVHFLNDEEFAEEFAKLPKLPWLEGRELSQEDKVELVKNAKLNRAVSLENPLLRPRSPILKDRREEYLKKVVALFDDVTARQLPVDTTKGMETAPIPAGAKLFELGSGPEMVGERGKKVQIVPEKKKVFLEGEQKTTAAAVKRLAEKAEEQARNAKLAREARTSTAAPGQVIAEEHKERKKKLKEWKESLGDSFDEKDF
jgi:hypothetical protein